MNLVRSLQAAHNTYLLNSPKDDMQTITAAQWWKSLVVWGSHLIISIPSIYWACLHVKPWG